MQAWESEFEIQNLHILVIPVLKRQGKEKSWSLLASQPGWIGDVWTMRDSISKTCVQHLTKDIWDFPLSYLLTPSTHSTYMYKHPQKHILAQVMEVQMVQWVFPELCAWTLSILSGLISLSLQSIYIITLNMKAPFLLNSI